MKKLCALLRIKFVSQQDDTKTVNFDEGVFLKQCHFQDNVLLSLSHNLRTIYVQLRTIYVQFTYNLRTIYVQFTYNLRTINVQFTYNLRTIYPGEIACSWKAKPAWIKIHTEAFIT